METQVINIDGKEYGLSYNLRAMILFEKIADKPFSIEGVTDWVMLAYSCFLSANPENTVTFDLFIDSISDEDMQKSIEWLADAMKVNNQFSDNNESSKKK